MSMFTTGCGSIRDGSFTKTSIFELKPDRVFGIDIVGEDLDSVGNGNTENAVNI